MADPDFLFDLAANSTVPADQFEISEKPDVSKPVNVVSDFDIIEEKVETSQPAKFVDSLESTPVKATAKEIEEEYEFDAPEDPMPVVDAVATKPVDIPESAAVAKEESTLPEPKKAEPEKGSSPAKQEPISIQPQPAATKIPIDIPIIPVFATPALPPKSKPVIMTSTEKPSIHSSPVKSTSNRLRAIASLQESLKCLSPDSERFAMQIKSISQTIEDLSALKSSEEEIPGEPDEEPEVFHLQSIRRQLRYLFAGFDLSDEKPGVSSPLSAPVKHAELKSISIIEQPLLPERIAVPRIEQSPAPTLFKASDQISYESTADEIEASRIWAEKLIAKSKLMNNQ
jgi:hypothetical protein